MPTITEPPSFNADWLSAWAKMDLSDVHGWPLWESEVFATMAGAYEELLSIFIHYSKCGQAGHGSAEATFTMQRR